jgi:hypothetical protein
MPNTNTAEPAQASAALLILRLASSYITGIPFSSAPSEAAGRSNLPLNFTCRPPSGISWD